MKITLGYSRVSTNEQEKEGISIENQDNLITELCNNQKLNLECIYKDSGISGTKFDRPELQKLLTRITKGDIYAVVVQDTSRLSRDTYDYLTIRALFRKYKIRLISINQPDINDSPEGLFLDEILAAVNSLQPRITGRKSKEVQIAKAKQGIWPSNAVYGYKNAINPNSTNRFDKKFVIPDEKETLIVNKIFELYSTEQYNVNEIVNYLNQNGFKSRKNKKFHKNSIIQILKNRFYVGELKWDTIVVEQAVHPPIISKNLFEKCNMIITGRNKNSNRKRKHFFLLSGHLYCNECGTRLIGEQHSKKDIINRYYSCRTCGLYLKCDQIESQLIEILCKYQFTESYANQILDIAKNRLNKKRKDIGLQQNILKGNKLKIETKMIKAENDLVEGIISGDIFNKIYSRLKTELADIESSIVTSNNDYTDKVESLKELLQLAKNISEAYKKAPALLKKRYISIFFDKLLVNKDGIVDLELSNNMKHLVDKNLVQVGVKWGG